MTGSETAMPGLAGEEDSVDDVNYAVVALDVGGNNSRIVHLHSVRSVDGYRLAFYGLRRMELDNIRRQDFATDDVVGEDLDKIGLCLRLKKPLKSFLRDLGEGLIGWSQDRERTGAGKSFDEIGGLHGGDESVERACRNCGFDNS